MQTHRLVQVAAVLLGALLLVPVADAAPAALPAGTLLPVTLYHGLNAKKLHPGQTIRLQLMQSIPGTSVHRGSKVLGTVVRVGTLPNGASSLVLRFEAIESHGQRIPIRANLRALASPLDVEEAQIPEEMSSRGMSPANWDTQQIGGDQVYRGGGPVTENGHKVGKPEAYGAVDTPQSARGMRCRGAMDSSHPQAMWLFSANACGVYGYPHLVIQSAGRSNGTVVLASQHGKLNVGGGSALLLRVDSEQMADNN